MFNFPRFFVIAALAALALPPRCKRRNAGLLSTGHPAHGDGRTRLGHPRAGAAGDRPGHPDAVSLTSLDGPDRLAIDVRAGAITLAQPEGVPAGEGMVSGYTVQQIGPTGCAPR